MLRKNFGLILVATIKQNVTFHQIFHCIEVRLAKTLPLGDKYHGICIFQHVILVLVKAQLPTFKPARIKLQARGIEGYRVVGLYPCPASSSALIRTMLEASRISSVPGLKASPQIPNLRPFSSPPK